MYSTNSFIPRFRNLSLDIDLDLFSKMGVMAMFKDDTEDFLGGMVERPKRPIKHWLYVSSILQKAFIEVNEEGTEAAAVTGSIQRVSSFSPCLNF